MIAARAPEGPDQPANLPSKEQVQGGSDGASSDIPSTRPLTSTPHAVSSTVLPIVVAVVAIIALTVFILWCVKRQRRRRLRTASILPIAEKPQLLEVHLTPQTAVYPSDTKWQHIMPLSAKYIPNDIYLLEQASVASSCSSSSGSPRSSILTASSASSTLSAFSWRKVSTSREDDGRLRVAVTIAMPAPRGQVKEKNPDGVVEEPAALCLGVTDIPWDAGPLKEQVA